MDGGNYIFAGPRPRPLLYVGPGGAGGAPLNLPVVQTFHALSVVKRRRQGVKDTSSPERLEEERRIIQEADRIVATCTDEVFELVRLGASRRSI